MLFITALASLLTLVAASPITERQSIDGSVGGQATRAQCTDQTVQGWHVDSVKRSIKTFCADPISHRDGGVRATLDIDSGRASISIVDSQGGSYTPCEEAFNWIADNCITQGKLGVYSRNGNDYKIVKKGGGGGGGEGC